LLAGLLTKFQSGSRLRRSGLYGAVDAPIAARTGVKKTM